MRSAVYSAPTLPRITPWLLRGFLHYVRWYARRHLHAVRLSRTGPLPAINTSAPLVIFGNHSSWWDPLIAFLIHDKFLAHRQAYFPMDAEALDQYPVLNKLGFFGIDKDSARGARVFLQTAHSILRNPAAVLFITPQGRFADVRERPLQFKPGLAHLAARTPGVCFLPAAMELCFWQERTPEALIRFGEPIYTDSEQNMPAAAWETILETSLQANMDALAAEAVCRNPAMFDNIAAGTAGVGGAYDHMRALRAWLSGEKFNPRHSQ